MKIKPILLSIGIISMMGSQYATATTQPLNSKIDRYVQNQFKTTQKIQSSILVILKKQADLSGADSLRTREEKGKFVYDALRNTAITTQKSLVTYLQTKKVSFRQFYIENMIVVENPTLDLVNELAAREDVAKIMGNPEVKLKLPVVAGLRTTHAAGPEKNLVRIGATKVWEKYNVRGEGIVVAGQDTGVEWNHSALINQYRGKTNKGVDHNYNWHDAIHGPGSLNKTQGKCGYDTEVPCDDHGHGTHTMGTIVGDDGKGNQIGVAPKAQWMACKNMDSGVGTPASYIECFEFFLAPYPLKGNSLQDGEPSKAPHVINNSWGCEKSEGCYGDEILPALQAMKKAGIFVVASAGNDGSSCGSIDAPPAWHSGLTLSVGAFDHRNDTIAFFSSRGPSSFDNGPGPNITAPGMSIRSSVPGNDYKYIGWSGTSMAGPHVVGAAALLWSFDKTLIGDIDKSITIIEQSAEAKTTSQSCGGVPGSHIPNNTYGYGLLNVAQAICNQAGDCSK